MARIAQKEKTTRITSPTEITSVRSTSLTDARIVVVWSSTTVRLIAEGMEAFSDGKFGTDAVNRINDIGARLAGDDQQHAGLPLTNPAARMFSTGSWTSATSESLIAAPL